MSFPYAKPLAQDRNGVPMQAYPVSSPAITAVAGVPIASSVISLNDLTTTVEMAVTSNPVLMKWGVASVTAANFDHVILPGEVRRFVVPISSQGTGNQSVAGINPESGLYSALAVIATGTTASVFTAQY